MDDDSHVRLLIVPHGPIGKITVIIPDGRFRVVSLFAPRLRFWRHERQLIEVNQPPD
jgi:hypothetical protein